jgi:thiol-disulfide isomerase/thioredoxin
MSNRNEKERRAERLASERAEERRRERRKDLVWFGGSALLLLAAVAIVALALSTRGKGSSSQAAQSAVAAAAPAPKRVPRQIATSVRDANKVVGGSIADRITGLKGVPVVVNQWASWCPNCKAEFGFFQQLSHRYARRVAFVGLDSQDRRGDAQAFLRKFPVPYPSLYDPGADQARSIGGGQGWPTTFYYDRTGRETYVREGGYTTLASLRADIQRYALGEG